MSRRVQISYKIGNSALKPVRKLKIGQWWLYRDSKSWDWPIIPGHVNNLKSGLKHITDDRICVVLITDLTTTPYGGEDVKVEFMKADEQYSPYLQSDKAWFVDQNFSAEEGYFTPFWVPPNQFVYKNGAKPTAKQYGVDCVKCRKHYPYAVRAGSFECWSCRNGY